MYQQQITLLFFIRREPERVSDPSRWKNKELCFFVCAAGAILIFCNFAETNKANFGILGVEDFCGVT